MASRHDTAFATLAAQQENFLKRMAEPEDVLRTKLILLIAANTSDDTIGAGCKVDIESVRHIFEKLSAELDFNFIELIIQGTDYNKKNILESIQMLSPGSNDIVVFYYSGHGFRYEKDESKKYPQIDMRSADDSLAIHVINENTENLADLFEIVKQRGARLNIVIGDCCNTFIDYKRTFKTSDPSIFSETHEPLVVNKATGEALFCDYTASILIAASDKGQYAVSDDKIGSLFTYTFSKNLKKILKGEVDKTKGLPWGELLEETKNHTLLLCQTYDVDGKPGNQQAIFEIESRSSLY